MRRLLLPLLAVCVLGLAACGDGKETASSGGSTATATTASTPAAAPAEITKGCKAEEAPKPRSTRFRRPTPSVDRGDKLTAVMDTSCGVLEIRLDTQRAPKTAASFAFLARKGFYDGLAFHRIVPGFVVQGGDPKGTGNGGPGYKVVEAPPEDLK